MVKFPSMNVSLYILILLVVGSPMYEIPLVLQYILANDSSVLKSIMLAFAASCVSVKLFRPSSFLIHRI